MTQVIMTTQCEGRLPNHTGKVRDMYDKGSQLLIVTTDRVSAYDVVMPQGIPYKGMVLHGITKFWLENLGVPNHFITDDLEEIGEPWNKYPETFRGRTMLVRKLRPLPVECIVRGYICGSAWNEYVASGEVCGVKLPERLNQNQNLLRPIFTPSTKAEQGEHDQNITCMTMRTLLEKWLMDAKPEIKAGVQVFAHDLAGKVHTKSVNLYEKIAALLWDKSIIMADTKFELGCDLLNWNPQAQRAPELFLIDEAGTPDSARFWDFRHFSLGGWMPSLDKQILRNHLDKVEWNRKPPAPDLPPGLIDTISKNYLTIYERITGSKLDIG